MGRLYCSSLNLRRLDVGDIQPIPFSLCARSCPPFSHIYKYICISPCLFVIPLQAQTLLQLQTVPQSWLQGCLSGHLVVLLSINLVNPPASPSPNSDRPTSELLGGTDMSQTPECDCSLIFVFEITVSDPFLSKHSRSDWPVVWRLSKLWGHSC